MSKSGRDQGRRERAAAIQAAQARSERNRRVGLTSAVIVVIAVLAAAVFWYSSSSGGTAATPKSYRTIPARTASLTTAPATTIGTTSGSGGFGGLVIGKPSAKIKVVVYEDFLCPYCREFEESSRSFLHTAASQGKVEVEYRPFHLLPEKYSSDALTAYAAVLKANGPTVALRFHDLLYDKQPYESASSFPGASDLASWAKSVGGSEDAVTTALANDEQTDVKTADSFANRAAVTSTPTIFVNGKRLSGASVTAMADSLEQMIATQK